MRKRGRERGGNLFDRYVKLDLIEVESKTSIKCQWSLGNEALRQKPLEMRTADNVSKTKGAICISPLGEALQSIDLG